MTFSLSTDRMLEDIYAASALCHLINASSSAVRPPVLTRDRRPLLERSIRAAFARLCFGLMPFVSDCSVDDPELLTLDLRLPEGFHSDRAPALRALMEQTLTADVLAEAYRAYDASVASANAAGSAESLRRLRRALDPPHPLAPSL